MKELPVHKFMKTEQSKPIPSPQEITLESSIQETAPKPVFKLLEQSDLTQALQPILTGIENIQVDLANLKEELAERKELLATELRIARIFEAMLQGKIKQ